MTEGQAHRASKWVLAAGVAVTLTVASHAHHSIGAVYDSSRQTRIEGVVVEFQFVNPHPFLIVTVTAAVGEPKTWRLEMDNRFELAAIGVAADTFQPGDRVVVAGSPGRTEENSLYVRALERPADGFLYEQVGSRPRINRAP